jgi:hypothetical protein
VNAPDYAQDTNSQTVIAHATKAEHAENYADLNSWRGQEPMLSKDCQGCQCQKFCEKRFQLVKVGEFVYCYTGDRHLVDSEAYPK